MILTELIGSWRVDDHKKPISNIFNRKNNKFKSLKEMALWSRENYFLVFPQQEVLAVRNKKMCDRFFIGTNLLWIDADYDVDIEELKTQWKTANLRGFFYFTTKYYTERIKRVRICIKVRGLTLNNAQDYAFEIANLLNLQKIDSSQYSSTSYYAPVRVNNETPEFDEDSLWVHTGKTIKLDVKGKEKQTKKCSNIKSGKPKDRKLVLFSEFLNSLSCVSSTTVRDNDTVNVIFKDIHEKTENGYFINPYNPWVVNHPNKNKTKPYSNEVFKKEFNQYKEYILENFPVYQPSNQSQPDETITNNSKYLNPSVFNNKSKLLFVESSTGSGKSTSLAQWLLKEDKSVLFISVNRAQAIQTHRSLLKEGLNFDCYLPTNQKSAKEIFKDGNQYYLSEFVANARKGVIPEKLICGALSLHHLIDNNQLFRTFDYIIIDEITTLPRAVINTVSLMSDHSNRFKQDMTALYHLLRTAQKIICLDGFIPTPVVKAVENISGKRKYHIRKEFITRKRVEIFLTNNPAQPKLNGKIRLKKFVKQMHRDINNNNQTLLIALSNKKKAHELFNYINLKHENISIKLLTKRLNQKQDIINFIQHLDENLLNTDIMIYSPTITTGVDIPQAKDTNVYHIIQGKHLSSHIHYQMTMRGRNVASYKVLLPTYLFNKESPTKYENLERKMIKDLKALSNLNKNKLMNNALLSNLLKKRSMGMGYVLMSRYLNKSCYKNINAALKNEVGIFTAFQLEKANIAMKNADREQSIAVQYQNLLAHEGCQVSIQLDSVKKTSEKREEELKVELRLLGIENKKIKYRKLSSLYDLKRKYVFSQQILLSNYKNEDSSNITIKTTEILKKAFNLVSLNFNTKKIEISNENLIKIYNAICKNILKLKDNERIHKIILDKFNNKSLPDAVKIRRVVFLLTLFFHTSRKN
ncbi:DEAD/DEAH box helicase family protein, partial [Desulfamplus magnetovallimortis]|uniref:DEAD/DEAH box helicase family protein n=1 Tax=Desulfamplus magnetovallimortis TaxID=1246637 RepID=UPI00111B481C